jgi:hypothetical protein
MDEHFILSENQKKCLEKYWVTNNDLELKKVIVQSITEDSGKLSILVTGDYDAPVGKKK